MIAYARVKSSAQQIAPRSTLGWNCRTRFPNRGVVVGAGSFLSRAATFYMVDIDKRAVRRIMVDAEPPSTQQVIRYDDAAELGPEDLNPFIGKANHVWRNGMSKKAERQPLHVTSSLLLLDGDLMFEDSGSPFHGLDKVMVAAVKDLVERKLPRSPTRTPTNVPCDQEPTASWSGSWKADLFFEYTPARRTCETRTASCMDCFRASETAG